MLQKPVSNKEVKCMVDRWKSRGWPYQMIERDYHAAKLAEDNAIFSCCKFYGHTYMYDAESNDLRILVEQKDGTSKYESWNDILSKESFVETNAHTWNVFHGSYYGMNGFRSASTSQNKWHLWEWKSLEPFYKTAPRNYFYVDIVSCTWEHFGFPGFGLPSSFDSPHGHSYIEFGDEDGNVYSVGKYIDPLRAGNPTDYLFGLVDAVLMSPDPYSFSFGEKTIHRYYIGQKQIGRKNFEKLMKKIVSLQQQVQTLYHQSFSNNCTHFTLEMEQFCLKEFRKQIQVIDLNTEQELQHVLPCRQYKGKDKTSSTAFMFNANVQESIKYAKEFIDLYYPIMDKSRDKISGFYKDYSTLSWNGTLARGIQGIMAIYDKLVPSTTYITTIDAQPMILKIGNDEQVNIVIVVSGTVEYEGQKNRKLFIQQFVLCQHKDPSISYFISSDVFRWVAPSSQKPKFIHKTPYPQSTGPSSSHGTPAPHFNPMGGKPIRKRKNFQYEPNQQPYGAKKKHFE